MCPPPETNDSPYPDKKNDQSPVLKKLVGGLAVATTGLLIATIVLAKNKGGDCGNEANNAGVSTTPGGTEAPTVDDSADDLLTMK